MLTVQCPEEEEEALSPLSSLLSPHLFCFGSSFISPRVEEKYICPFSFLFLHHTIKKKKKSIKVKMRENTSNITSLFYPYQPFLFILKI